MLGRFKNGQRDLEHLINRCAVVLDADYAEPDLMERAAELGYVMAWHTSWSHSPDAPRYRLIFPTEQRMDADQYRATADRLMGELGGSAQFDVKASRSPAQFMWMPATPDAAAYEHGSVDGRPVPVSDAAEAVAERPSAERTGDELDGYTRSAVDAELSRLDLCTELGWSAIDETGIGWDQTCYEVACNLTEIANSAWNGYTLDQAHQDFLDRAPTDGKFGRREHDEKWASARNKVRDQGRADPHAIPFEPLADEPGTAGKSNTGRYVGGGAFIHDAPDRIPALWGRDGDVLWAQGEALMIAGGSGVGKTTLVGQLVLALIVGGDVLGYPVKARRRVMYLAMDRPSQIGRSLRRTLKWVDRDVLDDRLVIWPGPPLADMAKDRELLLRMAREAGADTVVVDSLKDAAIGLSEDAVGAGYNTARQLALTSGVELIELHHLVKRGPNGEVPKALADLYGSGWLTAGAGSVVLLHGQAGDVMVKFIHLKQPENVVGPFTVLHDHDAGTSSVLDQVDLSDRAVVAVVERAGDAGITVADAASAFFGPDAAAKEEQQVRRKLDRLTRAGQIERSVESNKRTQTAARYRGITAGITAGSDR